jgi:hypothetical protein
VVHWGTPRRRGCRTHFLVIQCSPGTRTGLRLCPVAVPFQCPAPNSNRVVRQEPHDFLESHRAPPILRRVARRWSQQVLTALCDVPSDAPPHALLSVALLDHPRTAAQVESANLRRATWPLDMESQEIQSLVSVTDLLSGAPTVARPADAPRSRFRKPRRLGRQPVPSLSRQQRSGRHP